MAVKLNLLPQDYAISDTVAGVIKIVRPLNVILLVIFLITALGTAAYFVFSSISINGINTENNKLKGQIQSLQAAQQQVVLLKDRLGKIKRVTSRPNAYKNFNGVNAIISTAGDAAKVSDLKVDSDKTDVVLIFEKSLEISPFLARLNRETGFANILMSSFNYSPQSGYLVGLSFVAKK